MTLQFAGFQFRMYFDDEDFIAKARAVGIEPTRAVNNDGSVIITAIGPDGERRGVLTIHPIEPRTRRTPWNAPDDKRDEFAQWVADALNAASKVQP